MAVYCRECRCVFSRKHINCPFCGNPPQDDSRTVQELVDGGFRLIAANRLSGAHAEPDPEVQSTDGIRSDALDRLRRAYQVGGFQAQAHAASPSDDREIPADPPPSPPSREGGTDAADNWRHGGISGGDSPAGSARDSRRTEPPRPAPAPPVTPPVTPPDSPRRQRLTYEEQELRRLRRSQRAYRFHNSVSSIFSSIALLPWNWIFRVILVIAAVLLIWAFISAIPLLLNAALNLILRILPTILVILFIVWFFRNIFRL